MDDEFGSQSDIGNRNNPAKRSKLDNMITDDAEPSNISKEADIEMSGESTNVPNISSTENDDDTKSTISAPVEDSGYGENIKKEDQDDTSITKDEKTAQEASRNDANEAGTSSNCSNSASKGGSVNITTSNETSSNEANLSKDISQPNISHFARIGRRNRFSNRNYRTQIPSASSSDDDDILIDSLIRKRQIGGDSDDEDSASNSENEIGNASQRSHERGDSDSSSSSFHYSFDSDDTNSSSNDYEVNCTKDLILSKVKPNYNWNLVHEIMYREHGLSGKGQQTLQSRNAFQERVYGARHTIEKMNLLHKLEAHEGCVNSLNFNKAGDLLVSGSDDLKIILWKWASKKIEYSFSSGHNSNVFQTKFIELGNGINIVSSARDGQVRHTTIRGSGGEPISTVLIKHLGSVHKIAISQQNPYEILTAGEDGHVIRCDLRDNRRERAVTVKVKKRKVPLYSVAHHPLEQEFCVCGRDQFIRVYDKRNLKKPQCFMCPSHLEDKKPFASHITCAVYNWNGSEILASYSDEDIYLFNNRCYLPGHFTHRYKGHNNNKTIKGVNYFGLNSEYVVSGSDCGNFFFWDKETESIINWIKGDSTGVVNCLEPHPTFPILATSGLDSDVKLWVPSKAEFPPKMEGLERCVKLNTKRSLIIENDLLIDNRTFFFFVRQCLRNRRSGETDGNCPNVEDLISSDSGDEDDCGPDDENVPFHSLPCAPQ